MFERAVKEAALTSSETTKDALRLADRALDRLDDQSPAYQ
jgi:hypothetical protein